MKTIVMLSHTQHTFKSLAEAKRKGMVKESVKAEDCQPGVITPRGKLLTTDGFTSPADLSIIPGEKVLIVK